MEMLTRGMLRTAFRLEEEAAAVKGLLTKYEDVPMDLADACLVRMTELYAEPLLVTVDGEFRNIYRRHGRKVIPTVLPQSERRTRRK